MGSGSSLRDSSDGKIHIRSKKKIAFVCSGGAAKAGAFHLGVALALRERGFSFLGGTQSSEVQKLKPNEMQISTYVGSSAGAIISSLFAAGYTLENIFNSFLGREPSDAVDAQPKILPKLTYQRMFKLRKELPKEQIKQVFEFKDIIRNLAKGNWESLLEFRWLKFSGFFSTAGVETYMREEALFSNRFQDYLADLFIIGTQLNHSRKVVFGKYDYQPPSHDPRCHYVSTVKISDACAASTALPFVFSPYPIQASSGKVYHYIDGEIRDTLSTHVAVDTGADLVIASYTHQPYHFSREVGSLTEKGVPAILIQSIYLLIEQKINQHRFNKTNQTKAVAAVEKYCKQVGIAEKHQRRLSEILESELHHRRDTQTIYIHPLPGDHKMFFYEHFSLAPDRMSEIVRSGFRSAAQILNMYQFEKATD